MGTKRTYAELIEFMIPANAGGALAATVREIVSIAREADAALARKDALLKEAADALVFFGNHSVARNEDDNGAFSIASRIAAELGGKP